jgi:hypothetical protein
MLPSAACVLFLWDRAAAYRKSGWKTFDPNATPYDADQVKERAFALHVTSFCKAKKAVQQWAAFRLPLGLWFLRTDPIRDYSQGKAGVPKSGAAIPTLANNER